MKLNLYTVFVAEHLENTDNTCVSDDLTSYGKSFTCHAAAIKWVHDDIAEEIGMAWEDAPGKTDEDVVEESDKVFNEGNVDMGPFAGCERMWLWENCDRQYVWRLVEQELEIGGSYDDNDDTVMRMLQRGACDNSDSSEEV